VPRDIKRRGRERIALGSIRCFSTHEWIYFLYFFCFETSTSVYGGFACKGNKVRKGTVLCTLEWEKKTMGRKVLGGSDSMSAKGRHKSDDYIGLESERWCYR